MRVLHAVVISAVIIVHFGADHIAKILYKFLSVVCMEIVCNNRFLVKRKISVLNAARSDTYLPYN